MPEVMGFAYIRGGEYEIDQSIEPDLVLTDRQLHTLIPVLNEYGWITPTMDKQSREADLNIIGRLLDVVEVQARKST